MDLATLASKLEEDLCYAAPELHREKIVRRLNQVAGAAAEPLEEQITAWQEATGLIVGGDPDGVRPEHLSKLIVDYHHIAIHASRLLDALEALDSPTTDEQGNHAYERAQQERTTLREALTSLPEDG